MAHLESLYAQCARCPRRAKVELFNQFNASHGKFCNSCGSSALRELETVEKEADFAAARRKTTVATEGDQSGDPS